MNNESKCCEKCREVLGEGHPGEVFLACVNPSCPCHTPAPEDWEKELKKIPYWEKIDGQTQLNIKQLISILLASEKAAAREETAKAYGGCTNCYGKGYTTVLEHAGTSRNQWELPRTRPCSKCERGIEIEKLQAAARREGAEMMLENVIRKAMLIPPWSEIPSGRDGDVWCISKKEIEVLFNAARSEGVNG